MKARPSMLCALILLATSALLFAQKTEVTVRKGKVQAETQTATVNIDAGQKAVLKKDTNPLVTVDSPLVRDALELYKLVEKEKERGDSDFDTVFMLVGKADKDELANGALYFEFPNNKPEATKTFTFGPSSIIENIRFYNLNGDLCRVEIKRLSDTAAQYSVHLPQPVPPGGHFQLIGVVHLEEIPVFPGGAPTYWKEGPLWYFRTANQSPNTLNYYRLILPKSAILVDTNREIVAIDAFDGKVAVTMRNHTGPYADGMCITSFLWPDEDGTTLADIPDKYLGLRSKRDKEDSETYRREMHKIRAGMKYADQSTPLAALLTILGSAIQGDTELYDTVKYTYQAPDSIRKWVANAKYFADLLDFLSTPQWPQNPGNGYVHPVYLCRKGSKIDEFTQPIVYLNGKWYVHDTKGKAAGEAKIVTPSDIAAAKADGYLCDWEVAGPYVEKGKKSEELFDIAFGPELPDADVLWHSIAVKPYEQHPAYVDLDQALYNFDQAVAYVRTEIVSDQRKSARLEINTDDGVKAWLNGKVIHTNNVNRGVSGAPDIVAVTLAPGVNKLMLKVTDSILGWGAVVRLQPAGTEVGQN